MCPHITKPELSLCWLAVREWKAKERQETFPSGAGLWIARHKAIKKPQVDLWSKAGATTQVWKSTIALIVSTVVLFVGLALTVATCPNGAPCPSTPVNAGAGFIDIAGLILVPLSIVVWARQSRSVSHQRRAAEEAYTQALAQRREALSKMRIITRNCPKCGASLDLASASNSDRVRCGYCGNLIVYRQ